MKRVGLAIALTMLLCPVAFAAQQVTGANGDVLKAIEALHAQDRAATLANDPKALAMLWTNDAIRLEPGGEAEIGLAQITTNDAKGFAQRPKGAGMVRYEPDIKAIEVHGDWAVEWGYFTAAYRHEAGKQPKQFRAKLLRVLRRQPDGAWKFQMVMWNPV